MLTSSSHGLTLHKTDDSGQTLNKMNIEWILVLPVSPENDMDNIKDTGYQCG